MSARCSNSTASRDVRLRPVPDENEGRGGRCCAAGTRSEPRFSAGRYTVSGRRLGKLVKLLPKPAQGVERIGFRDGVENRLQQSYVVDLANLRQEREPARTKLHAQRHLDTRE
jgi:hypothetical protein